MLLSNNVESTLIIRFDRMKTILFALIREMRFELADPVEDIEARNR